MGFLIVLLTVAMVLVCIVLIFLVLLQLPKKEAGAGLAFGAGATDALFGAGSGNVLTKITKYTATTFFALAVVLSVLKNWDSHRLTSSFATQLQEPTKTAPIPAPPSSTPSSTPAPKVVVPGPATNSPIMLSTPLSSLTNSSATPSNPPAENPK